MRLRAWSPSWPIIPSKTPSSCLVASRDTSETLSTSCHPVQPRRYAYTCTLGSDCVPTNVHIMYTKRCIHTYTTIIHTYTSNVHVCTYMYACILPMRTHTTYTHNTMHVHIQHKHTWYVHTYIHTHTVQWETKLIRIILVYVCACHMHVQGCVWICTCTWELLTYFVTNRRLCGQSTSCQQMKPASRQLRTQPSAHSGVSWFLTSLLWSQCPTYVGYANKIVWQLWGLRIHRNQPSPK